MPPCVQAFLADMDAFYDQGEAGAWHGSPGWAERFNRHLQAMLPDAQEGNAAAQYAVATFYMAHLGHAREEDAIAGHEEDAVAMSRWLGRAARTGHLAAIDNLLAIGVGEEADRLRGLYKMHQSDLTLAAAPSEEWRHDMERLYLLAWGDGGE